MAAFSSDGLGSATRATCRLCLAAHLPHRVPLLCELMGPSVLLVRRLLSDGSLLAGRVCLAPFLPDEADLSKHIVPNVLGILWH